MFTNMNVKSLQISSQFQLAQRTFAAGGVLDRLTSVWKPSDEQERLNQARTENTAPSSLASALLQSEQQPSARQLTRAGVDGANVGSLWGGSFAAFAARFVERNPTEASSNPEAQKSSRVYASLTHEERVCLSDGTFHGRVIGDIADRTGLSRLDVANALLLPELERRWADRLRALRATRLPEAEKEVIFERVRDRARRLLREAYEPDGAVPLIAHPRLAHLLANRDSPLTYLPQDMKGPGGQACGLAGYAVARATFCKVSGVEFGECCGATMKRLPPPPGQGAAAGRGAGGLEAKQ